MKTPSLQSTSNYSQFQLFKSNREINKCHLNKLVTSIQQKNLLYLFPIVVNTKMEVVDGQHRLAAANQLQIPIYYFIDNTVTKADIAMVNNNRKGWVTMDFVHYYCEEGIQSYKNLFYLIDTYRVAIVGTAKLMGPGIATYYSGGNASNSLRAGNLDDTDFKLVKFICEVCADLSNDIDYAMKAWFMMDLKYVLVKDKPSRDNIVQKLKAKKKLFPIEANQNSMEIRKAFREILCGEKGHSKEETEKIIQKGIR